MYIDTEPLQLKTLSFKEKAAVTCILRLVNTCIFSAIKNTLQPSSGYRLASNWISKMPDMVRQVQNICQVYYFSHLFGLLLQHFQNGVFFTTSRLSFINLFGLLLLLYSSALFTDMTRAISVFLLPLGILWPCLVFHLRSMVLVISGSIPSVMTSTQTPMKPQVHSVFLLFKIYTFGSCTIKSSGKFIAHELFL